MKKIGKETKPKKLSIADIAQQLNVSKTAVSFVLNNKAEEKRISKELVLRIKDFIEKVGYRPNPIAKSLRTGKTNTIGLMVENIGDPFFAIIARLIESKANENGYKIIYCSTDNNTDKTIELLKMYREQNVDGYIIAPPPGIEGEIQSLIDEGLPVVFFDRYLPSISTDYIIIDNEKSTKDATKYLLKNNYTNVALITFASEQTQMQDRLTGYIRAMESANLKPLVHKIQFVQDEHIMRESVEKFLKANKQIDAILFGAIQAGNIGLKAMRKLNIKIPENMAVISFDDGDVFELFSPPITVIAQPTYEIAEHAIDILLKRLSNSTKANKIILKTKFIERLSSQNSK